jgi:uncharacterized protein (TIGR02145 family)
MKQHRNIGFYSLVIIGVLLMFTWGCKKKDTSSSPATVTDQEGNVYKTITIGTQVWMGENLRTTKYRNGDPIPYVTDSLQWLNLSSGAYCYDTTVADFVKVYGLLYNWYAATDSRKIAPPGWHVPSIEEWMTLIDYLGGDSVAGGKVKEGGTEHWKSPNKGATNVSGFTALPAGSRSEFSRIAGVETEAVWWSTSNEPGFTTISYCPFTLYLSPSLRDGIAPNTDGCSIRCIKD